MKLALCRVPFTPSQRDAIDALCVELGFSPIWIPDGTAPTHAALEDCEALIGYFPTELIAQLPKLHWLQTPCAGVERFCQDIYRNKDAVLTNCSGAFGIAIAEYMLAGILALYRHLPRYHENQKQKLWHCEGESRSIYRSRFAVIGTGNIGTSFAERAKALGASVVGVNRSGTSPSDCYDAVYPTEQILEAVCNVDAVVCALPNTADTRGLISRTVLHALDPDTILVNCGRGLTMDEAALIEVLQQKRIGGAVLDVFETEPLPAVSPLWEMENVILTPHVSGRDEDGVNAAIIYEIVIENLKRYAKHEPLIHVVDRTRGY